MKNLDQLDNQYRRLADDQLQPYLCDKEEIRDYFNEAIVEACRRSRLLVTSDPTVGEVKSTSVIQFSSGTTGIISGVLIGVLNIIINPIAFTNNLASTAILLCNEINRVGLYSATVNGTAVTINSPDGSGDSNNNIYPIISTNIGSDLILNVNAFLNGVNGICKISLKPGKSVYKNNDKIFQIKRAELGSTQRKLYSVDYRMMDERLPSWKTKTGTPRYLVYGMESDSFRLFNVPSTPDTINLSVTYLPLVELISDNDTPPINPRLHDKLVSWVLYRVYSKNDTQVKQGVVNLAKRFLNDFEAQFGTEEFASGYEEQFQSIHAEFNTNGSY